LSCGRKLRPETYRNERVMEYRCTLTNSNSYAVEIAKKFYRIGLQNEKLKINVKNTNFAKGHQGAIRLGNKRTH